MLTTKWLQDFNNIKEKVYVQMLQMKAWSWNLFDNILKKINYNL
jgi:hypothetical protein